MLVVLDDLDPIDGIGGEVTTGLVVVRPQRILPLDVELIDGFTLVPNLSIRPDLYPRELPQYILDIPILSPSEGLDPIAQGITPRGDRGRSDVDLPELDLLDLQPQGRLSYGQLRAREEELALPIAHQDEGEGMITRAKGQDSMSLTIRLSEPCTLHRIGIED